MGKNERHRVRGLAANIHNPKAAALACSINQGDNAGRLVRDAIIDAQIHVDWSGVAAIENSLVDVRNRTIARNALNVGGRALVVSRNDRSHLAQLIPEGFDHGLAWLVTLLFVRTDGDYDAGLSVGEAFHTLATEQSDLGIYWGRQAMCVPTMCFGPPARHVVTSGMASGDTTTLENLQDRGFDYFEAQESRTVGDIGATPLAYLIWGCHVTGVRDLNDIFVEDIWCPGLDTRALSERLVPLLASAAQTIEGDTYVHPEILSADKALDMANWVSREQTIHAIVDNVLDSEIDGAIARISLLEPAGLPYMDQLLLSFFNKANMLVQTFGFSRSGNEMEVDADYLERMLRDHGIKNVERVTPLQKRGSNDVASITVDGDGRWVPADKAGLGDAGLLIRELGWIDISDGGRALPGSHQLPSVLYVAQCGAAAVLGEHYRPEVWDAIKAVLANPGDPMDKIEMACKDIWTGASGTLNWLIEYRWANLFPPREIALAAQFKCSNGAVVVATEGLIRLLEQTDIGEDCPAQFLQSGFETMYLVTKIPADALDAPPDGRCFINGILAQRWAEGETQHLLLDTFLTGDINSPFYAYPFEAVPIHIKWTDGDSLGNIRSQIDKADGLGQQVLDLYAGLALYMNSKDARLVDRKDHSAAAKALSEKGRKKRKKEDYETANGSVDAIHIGPEESDPATICGAASATSAHKGKKAHYRRGFVRINQRVGKGRQQTRPVFIPPVLVNANKLAGAPLAKKNYKIG